MTERFPFGPAPDPKQPDNQAHPPLSLVNSHPLQIDPQRSRARSGEADP